MALSFRTVWVIGVKSNGPERRRVGTRMGSLVQIRICWRAKLNILIQIYILYFKPSHFFENSQQKFKKGTRPPKLAKERRCVGKKDWKTNAFRSMRTCWDMLARKWIKNHQAQDWIRQFVATRWRQIAFSKFLRSQTG